MKKGGVLSPILLLSSFAIGKKKDSVKLKTPLLIFTSFLFFFFLFISFLHFKTFQNSPFSIQVVGKVEERDYEICRKKGIGDCFLCSFLKTSTVVLSLCIHKGLNSFFQCTKLKMKFCFNVCTILASPVGYAKQTKTPVKIQ